MLRNTKEIEERIKILKDFLKDYSDNYQNPFAMLTESMKILEEKAPEGFKELAKHGWYLDYNSFPKTPVELGEELKKGNGEEVDKFLMEYYEEELENIESRLTKNNEQRSLIIKEGFNNHKNENYYSSITLLLTQADGLCFDKAKKFYFKNNSKLTRQKQYKPEIEEILTDDTTFLLKEFLAPMSEPTAINELSSKLEKFPVRLNRHEIIHGIDSNYGTKLNSLKIISFLSYINDVLN
jgi:hypothetical protein